MSFFVGIFQSHLLGVEYFSTINRGSFLSKLHGRALKEAFLRLLGEKIGVNLKSFKKAFLGIF
jgi:hypothetical protein